ncbi:hypothetical protein EVC12_080 [Rhizobium phage RHph_I42]|nr:hypothetical protein EVC12_080 [Rhizobium phage RHph_I42]
MALDTNDKGEYVRTEIPAPKTFLVKFTLNSVIPDEDLADHIYDLDDLRGTVRLIVGSWSIIDVINATRFLAEHCKCPFEDIRVEQNFNAGGTPSVCLVGHKEV